jgi:hypothetical protein
MIGNIIKGTNIYGAKCEGMIHDKVLCMQTIAMKQPGDLTPKAVAMALDAYVVLTDAGQLHLVSPANITGIMIPELQVTN